jgi:hypothetical protein
LGGGPKKIGGGKTKKEAPLQTSRKNQKTKKVSDLFFSGGKNTSDTSSW